jgi:hypothetical protein
MDERFVKGFVGKQDIAVWMVGNPEEFEGEVMSLEDGILELDCGRYVNYLDCEMITAIGEVA